MKWVLLWGGLIIKMRWFLLCLLICSSWVKAETIRVVGSSTLLPVMAEAAKQYQRLHPGVTITVSGGGSGVGVAAMLGGSTDLGMISRSLTAAEKAQLGDRVTPVTIARDAVAVVVSGPIYEAGVRALSVDQIAAVYRGKIRNWSRLGGPDRPILVIDKEAGRGTRHVFAQAVLGEAHARAPGVVIVAGSNNEMQALVARSDSAIGIVSLAWCNDRVRPLAIRTAAGEISPEGEPSGSYPLSRDLVLLTPSQRSAAIEGLIAYLLSQQGQAIVETLGYQKVR